MFLPEWGLVYVLSTPSEVHEREIMRMIDPLLCEGSKDVRMIMPCKMRNTPCALSTMKDLRMNTHFVLTCNSITIVCTLLLTCNVCYALAR